MLKRNVIILLLLINLFFVFVNANDNITINSTEVPMNKSFNVTFTNATNISIDIDRLDNTSLNFTYLDSYNFTNDTETLFFNLSMKNITENSTDVAKFNLSSNNTFFIYEINVTSIFVNEFVDDTADYHYVNISKGDYVVNLTTNTLPTEGSLRYDVLGVGGTVVNISCSGDWILCPDNSTFNSNNKTRFTVKYKIPFETRVGSYNMSINLSTQNQTRQRNIIFNLREPDIVYKNYVFSDSCYDSPEKLMECWNEWSEFETRKKSYIMSKFKTMIKNHTINKTKTEYVMAGRIDEDIMEAYELLKKELNETKKNLANCTKEYTKLNTKYSEMYDKNFKKSVELKERAKEIENITKKRIAENKEKRRKSFINWSLFLIVMGGIGFFFYRIKANTW